MTLSFTVLDGGLSTALEIVGADISGPLWTARTVVEEPEVLEEAHRLFVNAGAEIISSASYQCGWREFSMLGLDDREARRALASTITIARRAIAGTSTRVAASIGPFGAVLANGSEYTGRYGVDWSRVATHHRERIEVLIDAGADMFAVETIPLSEEGRLIAEILDDFGAPPAWFSFGVADPDPSGSTIVRTYGGDPISAAIAGVREYRNLVAVGVNCSHPDVIDRALEAIPEVDESAPRIVYPNHGRHWDAVARAWTGDAFDAFTDEQVRGWASKGAAYIGGCCGVGPEKISHLASLASTGPAT